MRSGAKSPPPMKIIFVTSYYVDLPFIMDYAWHVVICFSKYCFGYPFFQDIVIDVYFFFKILLSISTFLNILFARCWDYCNGVVGA